MQNTNSRHQLFDHNFLHAPIDTSGSWRLLDTGVFVNVSASRDIGDTPSHNPLPQSHGEPLIAHHNTNKQKKTSLGQMPKNT